MIAEGRGIFENQDKKAIGNPNRYFTNMCYMSFDTDFT